MKERETPENSAEILFSIAERLSSGRQLEDFEFAPINAVMDRLSRIEDFTGRVHEHRGLSVSSGEAHKLLEESYLILDQVFGSLSTARVISNAIVYGGNEEFATYDTKVKAVLLDLALSQTISKELNALRRNALVLTYFNSVFNSPQALRETISYIGKYTRAQEELRNGFRPQIHDYDDYLPIVNWPQQIMKRPHVRSPKQ